MVEEANKIKQMPEEIKEQHLQMLGLMKGPSGMNNGRSNKKKVSMTQVQVRRTLEKTADNCQPEDNFEMNSLPTKEHLMNEHHALLNNNSMSAYGEMKIKKITAVYKSQAQEIPKLRE